MFRRICSTGAGTVLAAVLSLCLPRSARATPAGTINDYTFDMLSGNFNILDEDSWTTDGVAFTHAATDNTATFSAGGTMTSWTFDESEAVVRVVVTGSGKCRMDAVPVAGDGTLVESLSRTVADGSGAVASEVVWDAADNVKKFRLRHLDETGNFQVKLIEVFTQVLPDLAAPSALAAEHIWCDGVSLAWPAVPNAASYSLEIRPADGAADEPKLVKEWDFSDRENTGGSKISLDSALPEGLSGENVFIYMRTNGFIHVGTSTDLGWLRIDAIPHGVKYVVVRASKYHGSGYGGTIRVEMDDHAGYTEEFPPVTLTTDFEDYVFDIDEVIPSIASPSFTIHSPTNHINAKEKKSIVRIESIKMLRSLEDSTQVRMLEGIARTNAVVAIDAPGDYTARIRARSAEGFYSPYSSPLSFSVTSGLGKRPRPFLIRLR